MAQKKKHLKREHVSVGRAIGRNYPILYRNKMHVPQNVVNRIALADTYTVLAKGVLLNAKVDLLYLAVDNVLTALIMSKEKTLSTTSHTRKIHKVCSYFRRQVESRSFEKKDFEWFYGLWQKYRYRLEIPKWVETEKMRVFAQSFLEFGITQVSRSFKSDETLLHQTVERVAMVHESQGLMEIQSEIHEVRENEAESYGEIHGGKLENKLLMPWNYIQSVMYSDNKELIDSIDSSVESRAEIRKILISWERILARARMARLKSLTKEITMGKVQRRKMDVRKAVDEALEAAREHPDLSRFRVALTLTYDSSEPYEMLHWWLAAMRPAMDEIVAWTKTHRAHLIKGGWQALKADPRMSNHSQ